MSEGWAHIQVTDEHYRKIREQLHGGYKYLELRFGSNVIPVRLDDTMPSGTMKMVAVSPYTRFVLWVENIGQP